MYYWIEDHLLPALYPDEYYNGEQISLEDSAMIIDSISYRVTPLRIAQHRAQPGANKFLRKEEKNQTNQKKLGSENVTMWLGRKKVEVGGSGCFNIPITSEFKKFKQILLQQVEFECSHHP